MCMLKAKQLCWHQVSQDSVCSLSKVPAKVKADCRAIGHLDSWLHCNARHGLPAAL